jgi:hypothetical protein
MTKPISGVAPLCGKALIMALRGAKFGTIDARRVLMLRFRVQ